MRNSLRLLIAEDESLVGEMVQGIVEGLGHSVLAIAGNGMQAVELTNELRPSLVIMDIKMPDMDGIEAARRIADICPTPVVVLTAFETPEMIQQVSAAGVGAYLTKPPNAREMDRAITIAMARFGDMMELRRANEELKKALFAVKRLSGLLPICSNCKRIRDDKGRWKQVEEYIQNNTQAEFTHGVCPDCAKEVYPSYKNPRNEQ